MSKKMLALLDRIKKALNNLCKKQGYSRLKEDSLKLM